MAFVIVAYEQGLIKILIQRVRNSEFAFDLSLFYQLLQFSVGWLGVATLDYTTLFKLIERQGTIEQVSSFLRKAGLPFSSGSWRDMIDRRLRPAVDKGLLNSAEVLDLLRQTEEYGAQHVFLYTLVQGKDVSSLFSPRLNEILKSAGFPALGDTSIVDMPTQPKLVEVRIEDTNPRSIVFKIVEKRSFFQKISDQEGNGKLVVTYDEVPYRAVNLMRIFEDGRAEICVQSHTNISSYGSYIIGVFNQLAPVVSQWDWKEQHLDKFKSNLFDPKKRITLQDIFGLRHAQHSNVDGTRLTAAAGTPGASMYDDPYAVASVDSFTEKVDHAYCERVAVTLKKSENFVRPISLVIGGETNELAITSKVSRSEYDYILKSVLKFII